VLGESGRRQETLPSGTGHVTSLRLG
jgi:hypothetical protein